jgi:hypothetical protein
MDEAKWVELITAMQLTLDAINGLKAQPQYCDPRAMAVAATNLETAMLWVANARKES